SSDFAAPDLAFTCTWFGESCASEPRVHFAIGTSRWSNARLLVPQSSPTARFAGIFPHVPERTCYTGRRLQDQPSCHERSLRLLIHQARVGTPTAFGVPQRRSAYPTFVSKCSEQSHAVGNRRRTRI